MRRLLLAGLVPAILQSQPVTPDSTTLRRLIVTAERVPIASAATNASVTVLSGGALRAAGITHVLEALRQVPGVSVARAGSFGAQASVFTRGGESDFTKVMIDGVAMNDPGGAIDLGALTIDDVERIEIVRGPSSVVHGSDAVSGVIHLITRRGEGRPRSRLSAGGGSYGSVLVDAGAGASTGRLSWNGNVARQHSDGTLPFNNAYRNQVVSGRVAWSGSLPLSLTLRHGDNRFEYPTDGTGQVVDINANRGEKRTSAGLELQRVVGPRTTFRMTGGWMQVRGDTRDAPDGPADTAGFYAYRSDGRVRRGNVAALAEVRVSESNRAVAGVEWADEHQRLADSSNYSVSTTRFTAHRITRSGFAQFLGRAGRLGYSLGSRWDDNDAFGSFGTARANATLDLVTGLRVRAGLGTSFKAPTFFEQFSTAFSVGNPDLVPERTRAWEAALEHRSDRADVTLAWFDQSFRDLIQYTFRSPTDPSYFNVAAARARGAELEATVRVTSDLVLRGGATRLLTRVDNPGFDRGAGATFVQGSRLLRRPGNTWSAGVTARTGSRASSDLTVLRVGTRDDRDFSTFPATPVELAPYTRVDAATRVRLTPQRIATKVALVLRAENLFGAAYEEVVHFAAPRRNLFAGLQADWSW